MNQIIDLKDDYNRHLRRRQHVKALAWLLRFIAAMILLIGFGALIALINDWPLALIAVLIVLAGIWGQHYLNTRH